MKFVKLEEFLARDQLPLENRNQAAASNDAHVDVAPCENSVQAESYFIGYAEGYETAKEIADAQMEQMRISIMSDLRYMIPSSPAAEERAMGLFQANTTVVEFATVIDKIRTEARRHLIDSINQAIQERLERTSEFWMTAGMVPKIKISGPDEFRATIAAIFEPYSLVQQNREEHQKSIRIEPALISVHEAHADHDAETSARGTNEE